jgi:signal peptidase II
MGHLPSHLRLWLGAVLGVAADLWSKEWAFEKLEWNEARVVIENLCSLQKSLNPGALFGFGAGWAPIFVGASVLALLFVLYLFANSTTSRRSMHVALGLVLAGAIGNLYDRATQTAYVAHIPGQGRDIGILIEETESQVIIADFPDGGHRRMWPRSSDRRSGLQPVVRDFIKIEAKVGGLSLWPWVFNVADALLVVGVVVLLLNLWAERKPRHRPRRTILPPESV